MFAVIKTGGKQYRVAAEDLLKIDRIQAQVGETVAFGEVLMVGGEAVTIGAPTVAGAAVAAQVVEQGRAPKVIAFKKRRRKNSRRKHGHRQPFTLVRITEILTDGRQPSLASTNVPDTNVPDTRATQAPVADVPEASAPPSGA